MQTRKPIRSWYERTFFPWAAVAALVLWSTYLVFFMRGGFSNTDSQVGLAFERVVFGNMFYGPFVVLAAWVFSVLLGATMQRLHDRAH